LFTFRITIWTVHKNSLSSITQTNRTTNSNIQPRVGFVSHYTINSPELQVKQKKKGALHYTGHPRVNNNNKESNYLILIVLGFADSALGKLITITPFSYEAETLSTSQSAGIVYDFEYLVA